MMKAGCAMLTMSRMPNEIETPSGHGGVEPAEQDARDQGIDHQIEAETHLFPPVARFPPNTFFGGRAHFILVASVQEGRGLG